MFESRWELQMRWEEGFWETRSALTECSCGQRGGRNQPYNQFVSPDSVHRRSSLFCPFFARLCFACRLFCAEWVSCFFCFAFSGDVRRKVLLTQLLLVEWQFCTYAKTIRPLTYLDRCRGKVGIGTYDLQIWALGKRVRALRIWPVCPLVHLSTLMSFEIRALTCLTYSFVSGFHEKWLAGLDLLPSQTIVPLWEL